ncbi:MAG: HAD family hydrolase [Acidimicrobiales bacterium]
MSPSIVVFDLGNVLVRWDRRLLYRTLIDDPAELDRFLGDVLTMEENAALDRGTPLAEMTADLARRHPADAALIDAFRTRWIETIGEVIHESVGALEELLARGVRCYALSNWGADTFEQVADRFEWLSWFDGLVISGREGMVKPEREIFDLLCRRYDFVPTEALFIDDSTANIATARQLGFATMLFVDPADLRPELERHGLL